MSLRLDLREEIDVDVLVVGGGGAGLRAAYEASKAGARTALLLKGRVTASGATAFGVASLAGFAVPDGKGDPLDSPDVHFDDIMRAASGCADPKLVRVLVDEAVSVAEDLERWGVPFVTDPNTGSVLVAMGDFASRPRNRKIYHHGKPITVALKTEIERTGVRIIDRSAALGLLQSDRGVDGVLAIDSDGRLIAIRAGAVVLATGGAGQLFKFSLMPPDITGDGYAFGYRAGATLVNMEYMQVGFGTIRPALNIIMAWFWALFPKFVDRDGRPILDGILPDGLTPEQVMKAKVKHYPFSTSDDSKWLEIGAKRAMSEGRTTDLGGFYLDLREVDESVLPKGSDLAVMWPISKGWLLRKHMDVTKEPLSIGLFGHSINGGLVIDSHGQSTVPGLFAVGETAGGPYGADRLGGNMLLNCQVFGKRAGRRAAEVGRARRHGAAVSTKLPELDILRRSRGARDPREATLRIKEAMTRDVLAVRTERGLVRAAEELSALRDEIEAGVFNADTPKRLIELHEALSLLDTGQMIIAAARLRTETRGSHYREDFPSTDPDWTCPIFVRRSGGGPEVEPGRFA
ncbi:MAG TPA: FAD-binding protein [Alphaproteobacteria bacterium]